jgi:hypothetical protein
MLESHVATQNPASRDLIVVISHLQLYEMMANDGAWKAVDCCHGRPPKIIVSHCLRRSDHTWKRYREAAKLQSHNVRNEHEKEK